MTNIKILEAMKTIKVVCGEHYSDCTQCPFGFETIQNRGDTCSLQYTRPKDYNLKDSPSWKVFKD